MEDPTLDISAMAARLRAAARELTPAERAAGRDWYPAARRIAAGLHASPAAGAAIIAAISPRQSWSTNVKIARELAADPHNAPRRTLSECDALARRIALGEDPEVLTGPKRRAFAAAILGDPDAVTVDVHAARVAGWHGALTPARYQRIAEAYRQAAASDELSPRDLQAALWVQARGRPD